MMQTWRRVLKSAAQGVLPAAIERRMTAAFHFALRDAAVFTGDYGSWAEAAAAAKAGYAAPEILRHARHEMAEIAHRRARAERDGRVLPQATYGFPVLASLLWIGSRQRDGLGVVDFGGALGNSYFQYRDFLGGLPGVRWAVVEQPHFAECGQREFATEGLSFHATMLEALRVARPNVLLASGVLQYLPDPYGFIAGLRQFGFENILFDRTAFHRGTRERLAVQHNPGPPRSRYPGWFFNEQRFLSAFPDYRVAFSFEGRDHVYLRRGEPYFRGFLFTRVTPAAHHRTSSLP